MDHQMLRQSLQEQGNFLLQLKRLRDAGQIPTGILAQLACDTALYALHQSPHPLAQTAPACFAAIELRRRWLAAQRLPSQPTTPVLVGDDTFSPFGVEAGMPLEQALQRVVDAARRTAHEHAVLQTGTESTNAAADAADQEEYALRALAWAQAAAAALVPPEQSSITREQEAERQRQAFLVLLEAPAQIA